MDVDQLWDKYLDVRDSQNTEEKLAVLMECAEQEEDVTLTRVARHDLGFMYYQGKGVAQDKERGKVMMKSAADLGYGPAMNLYGQMLTHEGDWEAFDYITKALMAGEIVAAKNLHKFSKSTNPDVVECVNDHMEDLVAECKEMIEKGKDENGKPQLALALAGLYGLAGKQGVSRENGKEYLKQAADKGNGQADFILRNPSLQSPETEEQFKGPSKEEMAKAKANLEKAIADAVAEQNEKKKLEKESEIPVETTKQTTPFGMSDIKFGLGCGLVGSLLLKLIFHTGFLMPFIIISLIVIGLLYSGSSK